MLDIISTVHHAKITVSLINCIISFIIILLYIKLYFLNTRQTSESWKKMKRKKFRYKSSNLNIPVDVLTGLELKYFNDFLKFLKHRRTARKFLEIESFENVELISFEALFYSKFYSKINFFYFHVSSDTVQDTFKGWVSRLYLKFFISRRSKRPWKLKFIRDKGRNLTLPAAQSLFN